MIYIHNDLALKILNLKTILRPSIVGGMPLKHTHVVPSLNIGCTPRGLGVTVAPKIAFRRWEEW